jgi:radical SAM superfamily enzyme YgiQ (UPF0313 family)
MKVLLFNPKATQLNRRKKAPSAPLGLLAIASYIKAKGHTVKVVDLTVKANSIEKCIRTFNPDVVGVSFSATLVGNSTVTISRIAKKYNVPVVWGGHMPSSLPDLCFKEGCVDFIVIGEGEVTFSKLLDTIDAGGVYSDIDGLAYVDKDGMHINKHREFADLNSFPATDWSLVNPEKYCQVYFVCKKMMYLYSSKGCPVNKPLCFSLTRRAMLSNLKPLRI